MSRGVESLDAGTTAPQAPASRVEPPAVERGRVAPGRVRPERGVGTALTSRVAGRALGLAFIVYLARAESPATFAAYSYLLVLAATLGILADSGIGAVAAREVARATADVASAYRAAFPIASGTGLLAAAGVAVVGALDRGPGTHGAALAWASVFVAANVVFGFQAEILRASGRHVLEASVQVAAGALQFTLGVLVIAMDGGLALLMAVLACKELCVAVLSQLALPAPWRGARRPRWRGHLLRRGLWLGGASTALAIVARIGQVTLSNAGDIRTIADYSAAARVLDVTLILTWTVGLGLFPWMAGQAHHEPGNFRLALLRLLVLPAGGTLVACLCVLPLVGPVMRLLFGPSYDGAVEPAMALLLSPPALIVLFISWNALVALGGERQVAAAALAGVLATVAGCALIVASPTALGTAVVTMAGMGFIAAALAFATARRMRTALPEPAKEALVRG
jgi:O-antigen/teichoic acid export membrane protein